MTATTFDPLHSDRPLIVYLDVKSPYAFIARDPTSRMADELGIEVDWRPLTLDIPSYLGSARLDDKGKVAESDRTPEQWTAVRYAYRDARRYAAMQGYGLRGTEKIWDTSLVHMAFWWAKTEGDDVLRAFLDHLYPRFWLRDFDAEDPRVVAAALGVAGADIDGFTRYAAGQGRDFHDRTQRAVFDAGIFGVPGYVVDGEYHFGREHLPTVRWMLEGRRGPRPDVGNPVEGQPADPPPAGPLTVALDFRDPESYLILPGVRRLLRSGRATVEIVPFLARRPLRAEPDPGPDGDRTTRHMALRASYRERDLRRYADALGLSSRRFDQDGFHRPSDGVTAAAALEWVRKVDASRALDFASLVAQRYWNGSFDLDSGDDLETALHDAGVATDGFPRFAATEGPGVVEETRRGLLERGCFASPHILWGDELYLGRQHLSLLAARLALDPT